MSVILTLMVLTLSFEPASGLNDGAERSCWHPESARTYFTARFLVPMIDRDKLYQEIGKRVKDARKAHTPELTQGELADLLDVERTSITNIEQGSQRATLHFIYLLTEKLHISLGKLLPSPDNEKIHSSGELTELAQVKLGKGTKTVPSKMKSLIEKV